jgi:serine/threonine protein kinase
MLLTPGSRPVPNCPDYALVGKLGAGAFGEVWHANGPGGIEVALKFIRLSEQSLALELRSLDAVKSIRHPNLVSLFGAWQTDNWLILAMELCDCSLLDLLAEAQAKKHAGIPLAALLDCMSDAANGLDALNAKQVQHRDVKPANLLLLNSGVKVADFGLAKALEHTVGSNTGAGTLAYTAPECFRGKLSQQSDQYSLAVTYYHLRIGQLLFKGDQAQVMYGHLELEPDLSALAPEERAVLARALAKEPGQRWANCRALVDELTKAHQNAKAKDRERQAAELKKRQRTKASDDAPTGAQRFVHPTGRWQPTTNATDHLGQAIAPDADFFAAPPFEIGSVVSACTSLTDKVQPMSLADRLCVSVPTAIGCLIAFVVITAIAQAQNPFWIFVWRVGAPGLEHFQFH